MLGFFKSLFAWIEVQLEWLKSFLSEADGKGSSKRVIGVLTVIAFLFAYIKTALVNNKVEDIPFTWALLIAGIIGLNIYDRFKNKSDMQQ